MSTVRVNDCYTERYVGLEVRQSASKSLVQIAQLLPEDIVHENVLRIVLHLAHDEMDEHKITALPVRRFLNSLFLQSYTITTE